MRRSAGMAPSRLEKGQEYIRMGLVPGKGGGYVYRYVPVTQAVMIDKIFKFSDFAVELGGTATQNVLKPPSSAYEDRTNIAGIAGITGTEIETGKGKGKGNGNGRDLTIPEKYANYMDSLHRNRNALPTLGTALPSAVAVHTTCYEQKVKVMGLKAANAYWNPYVIKED